MQAYATSDPEIRAHVRSGYRDADPRTSPSWPVSRVDETWDFFAHGMLLNVDGHARHRLDARSGDLPSPARDRLGRAGARGGRRRVRAAGLRRARQRERLRRPVAPRRSQARDAVNDATGAFASPSLIALVRLGADADSAAAQERIARVAGVLRDPGRRVGGRLRARRRPPAGLARRALDLPAGDVQERPARARGRGSRQRSPALPWVTLGGGAIAAPAVGDQVSEDIARAELIAFPILFLLTLLVFRSAVSALLPLAVGATTILLSFLAIRVVNNEINPMSIYALNLINGLGLGLAIDYSLFMVSRFREELAAGRDREAALRDDAAHRRPRRGLLGDHRGRRAGGADRLPPALPVLDGRRRDAVRADRRRRVADAAARRCWGCSASASTRAGRGAGRRRSRARRGPSAAASGTATRSA